jgi:acetyltransferase-like isoleucine patch superfamily enzyme
LYRFDWNFPEQRVQNSKLVEIAQGLMTKLKRFLNSIRTILLFRIRYPWITYGRNVHVKWSAAFWAPRRKISLGNNVGIGKRCVILSDLTIGNDVMIAPHVAMLSRHTHRYDIVGTSMFQSPRGDKGDIVIEDDVWIGFGAIILSGVRIGRGSIIAAGAVVLEDVPPYSIFIPVQNHVLKRRFSPQQIELHEQGLKQAGVMVDEPR